MAISKYSQAVQIQPIDVFDEEVIGKALTIKQLKYDEGVKQYQLMLNQTAGLDIVNENQKKYLDSKIANAMEEARKFGGVDFSDQLELNKINSLVSSITDDPIIRNAVQSSSRFRQFQKNEEEMWTNPKLEHLRNPLLKQYNDSEKMEYLNSSNLNASWNKTTPDPDSGFDKEFYIATNEVKTTKGTRFLSDGRYTQDYQYRTNTMMLNAQGERFLSNPEHLSMFDKEFSVIYNTEDKQKALFERGLNAEKLKYRQMLKEYEAQSATDQSGELKGQIDSIKNQLATLDRLEFSENSARGIYYNQRLLKAMAPEINVSEGVRVNQGYYKDIELRMSTEKMINDQRLKEQQLQLQVDSMLLKANPNFSSQIQAKYGYPTNVMTSDFLVDPMISVPENGKTVQEYTDRVSRITNDANQQLRQGMLSLISKGNTEFYNQLKANGVLDEVQSNTTLGKNALRTINVLNERLEHKKQKGETLSPVEQDFSRIYSSYKKADYTANIMKEKKEKLISPILKKYGYTYEDWIQHNINKKDDGWRFSDLFSSKVGIEKDIDKIDKEIEETFSNSSLNTFKLNNVSMTFPDKPDSRTRNLVLNEIRTNGLSLGDKHYSVNNALNEDSRVISNVQSDKIKLISFNPNTNEATVEVAGKIADKANINTYKVKMSDQTTAEISMNSGLGKPISSSYNSLDDDLENILKAEKSLSYNGKELGFSLSSITGLPLSNEIFYTYDPYTDSVGVKISGFGSFRFKDNTPRTMKDAESKIQKLLIDSYSNLKKKNPSATDQEIFNLIFKNLKDNGYAYY